MIDPNPLRIPDTIIFVQEKLRGETQLSKHAITDLLAEHAITGPGACGKVWSAYVCARVYVCMYSVCASVSGE